MADNELMITKGLKSCTLTPTHRQTTPFAGAGNSKVIVLGASFWSMRCEYANMREVDWGILSAWVSRRRGALSPFAGLPGMKRTPLNGATTCTIAAQGSDELRIASSPALNIGDYVSFDSGSGRFLGLIEEITAVGAGYIDVKTFPDRPSSVGANPACVDPTGYFQLVPSTIRMSDPLDPKKTLSFEARQVEPI